MPLAGEWLRLLFCILIQPTYSGSSSSHLRYDSVGNIRPSDDNATAATSAGFAYLANLSSSDQFLFGHHNTNWEGQLWSVASSQQHNLNLNRSDVFTAVGQYPAVVGYNLDWVTPGDTHNATTLLRVVNAAVQFGAIPQFYWQARNPVTNNDAHDLSGNPVESILQPGTDTHTVWIEAMDHVAAFLKQVQAPYLLLRLFHENTGTIALLFVQSMLLWFKR